MDLVAWSRATFGNTRNHFISKQGELEELMEVGFGANLDRINEVKREINELLHHEEVFWWQRARFIWLPVGDKNTKYFHQIASQRWQKNIIDGFHSSNGVWCTDTEGIATEYYKNLFTTSNNLNMDGVLASVEKVVTNDMAKSLVCTYTKDEIRVEIGRASCRERVSSPV